VAEDLGIGSTEKIEAIDLSLLPKIVEHITLYEWMTIAKDIVKFHKSQLTSEVTIEDNLHTCLQYMNDHGLSFLALINPEKTTL
jgi:uncharacterized membrane protein